MARSESNTSPRLVQIVLQEAWTAVAVVLVVIGIATSLQPAPTFDGDPISGLSLYAANCTRCHTATGGGGVRVGSAVSADIRWPSLAPTLSSPALIRRAMLAGVNAQGDSLDSQMPRFHGRLIDAEVDNIVAFLQTLS